MRDPKVIKITPDLEAKSGAVIALMIEEFERFGYVQRDEDATECHRQRLSTLVREARAKRGL